MPAFAITMAKLIGSTLLTTLTSLMTADMIEWAFWWLADKLVKSSDETWDDELLARMKAERAKVKEQPSS